MTSRFWSPTDFEPNYSAARSEYELSEELRELLCQAVRARLTGGPDTWSMLSGGMDSSSVVSNVQWLANQGAIPHGLGGTVTWVDSRGTGTDEREFSDAVVRQYGIRNEQIIDYGYLHDDGDNPPPVDQPNYAYPLYARDRRTARIVRRAGGRVLLTGYGGDNLFLGSMFFFSDWIAHGDLRKAATEMLRRAALGRASIWELAYKNAVFPLFPRWFQRAFVPEERVPSWVTPAMLGQYDLASRASGARAYAGRLGHKYAHYVAEGMSNVSSALVAFSALEEIVELRHPYLYRPLAEFALRLPPEMCVQPNARKWILRQAMRGILPDAVRTRVGKAAIAGTVASSVVHRRDMILRALRDPVLEQLGCIDGQRLRTAVESAQSGDAGTNLDIGSTLAVEMWLQVRSGRWGAGERMCWATR